MIDFGLANFYIDSNGDHIEDIMTENLVGTPKYISYNVHCGHNSSRRDDMLSLGYMFLWIEGNTTLFSNSSTTTLENKDNFPITHILHPSNVYLKDKKSRYLLENLCSKYDNIYRYLEYCYRLSYEGSPLYGELQKLFLDK